MYTKCWLLALVCWSLSAQANLFVGRASLSVPGKAVQKLKSTLNFSSYGSRTHGKFNYWFDKNIALPKERFAVYMTRENDGVWKLFRAYDDAGQVDQVTPLDGSYTDNGDGSALLLYTAPNSERIEITISGLESLKQIPHGNPQSVKLSITGEITSADGSLRLAFEDSLSYMEIRAL